MTTSPSVRPSRTSPLTFSLPRHTAVASGSSNEWSPVRGGGDIIHERSARWYEPLELFGPVQDNRDVDKSVRALSGGFGHQEAPVDR
jgi:hypothetical protein